MATNPYFKNGALNEQSLYEDLVIESIKMYGQDVLYLPRTAENIDAILNENVEATFDRSYNIEMYIEDVDGFGGEGNLLSKFGLEIRDEATFIVAKRSWERYIQTVNDQLRPKEGDLIYLPLSKSLFEISFVEHEKPFYQLKNLPVYQLQVRLFEYNDEEFNTKDEVIDAFEEYAYNVDLNLGSVTGEFELQERVEQTLAGGVTISAEIVKINGNVLSVSNIETSDDEFHEFIINTTITGLTSGATAIVQTEPDELNNDPNAQNDTFESFEDDFIDFSESNPFSEG